MPIVVVWIMKRWMMEDGMELKDIQCMGSL
jgi:hypothetical protein